MKQHQIHLLFTGGRQGRREHIAGQEYAVYPVVMLVPGVHQGAIGGPVYYPPEVIAASVPKWNGIAATVNHPINAQGDYCLLSENPEIKNQKSIGDIASPFSKIGKLMGKIRLNVLKTNQTHPGMIEALDSGQAMDVSTGLLALDDGRPGQWNGERYEASITEIIPDHLALLPDQAGACSWQDGCGIRANSNSNFNYGVNQMTQEAYVQPKPFEKSQTAVNAAIQALCAKHGDFQGRAKARTMKFTELVALGETLLNSKGTVQEQDQDVYVPVSMFSNGGR